MHFLYLDESGKSGPKDFTQPWYVLGGVVVHESRWVAMEASLNARIDELVPPPRSDDWELHMAHLFHGKSHFKGMPKATRYALVDAVFDAIDAHDAKVIVVAIDKRAHDRKYYEPDPVEGLAYRFMIERFNTYVGRHEDKLGLVVCDEQKELEKATRHAHSHYRRLGTGQAVIDHVIETPFFTPSHWSRMLQVVDVVTYWTALHLRGKTEPSYWDRIEPRLDRYPLHTGKGLKLFP